AKQREEQEEKARAEEMARAEKGREVQQWELDRWRKLGFILEPVEEAPVPGPNTKWMSLEQIEEEAANLEASKSVQDLRDHLARFPGGITECLARARLEDLVWARVGRAPKLDKLNSFLTEFPQGRHAKEAMVRRAALERDEAAARVARQRQQQET